MRRTAGGVAPRRRVMPVAAVAALGAVASLGMLAVLATAALDDRERAFAVGLPAVRIAAVVQPGGDACRGGIDVPAGFSRIRLTTASFRRPGPPLTVKAGAARGRVAGGYPDNSTVEAHLDATVAEAERILVCVTNEGDHPVALLGSPRDTPPYQLTYPALEPVLGVEFLSDEPRSMAVLVPEAFERASRFRPAWVGPWTFWALLGLVAAGVPALLAGAYRSVASDSS